MHKKEYIYLKAVLFDLDGVLVDACDWHYEALNKALLVHALPAIDYNTHLKEYNGLPTKIKLIKLGVKPELIDSICDKKQEFTFDVIQEKAVIDESKIKLLEELQEEGIKIACVTNSIRDTARFMLKRTGILPYMDVLVSNECVGKNKPLPDCYNFAMELLKEGPLDCVCVEDSDTGYKAAIRSGVQHIWRVKNAKEVNFKNFARWLVTDTPTQFHWRGTNWDAKIAKEQTE